jgi:hypothetical protein
MGNGSNSGIGYGTPLVAQEDSQVVVDGAFATRTVRCDGDGRLEVVAAAGGMDVNLAAVGGVAVASDGAGTQYNGVFGFLGDLTTLEPILAIRFRPQAGEGQTLAVGPAAVSSVALTVDKAHWIWSDVDTWIRIGAGAAAVDFPLPQRTAVEYIPTAVGVDDVISVIQLAGAGNLYIGQSEA